MKKAGSLSKAEVERFKRKVGLDDRIAAKHKLPVGQVEEDFDPRLLRLILLLKRLTKPVVQI